MNGPDRDPTERAGADYGESPLEANDLTWNEVADAVWLATVTENDWRRNPEPREPAEPPRLPADLGDGPALAPGEPELGGSSVQPLEQTTVRRRYEAVHLASGTFDVAPSPDTADALHFPGSLEIVRALRPLKRKVRSWDAEFILDEEATAEQAAQDRMWLPVTKPATTRWLDLTLVVDAGPSMALWHSKTAAFIALLEQLGAFRTIQVRLLDTHQRDPDSPATPVLRGGTPETPSRGPAELLDPPGRRIMMVLTDAIGESWQQDLVSPMLAQWGAAMPVAIVHLLPQRLWNRGGLALRPARLTVPNQLKPNRQWGLELPDDWLDAEPVAAPSGRVPIPVLQLDARWLRWWARLITGEHRGPANALVLLAGDHSPPPAEYENGPALDEPSATEQVQNFFSVASPPASRLATLLAAVPVSVPMAKLVQAEMVPESSAEHLAEVLSSGLLHPSGRATRGRAWDTLTFDFPNTVREVLLSGARRSETAQVVQVATKRFGNQISVLTRIRNALEEPDTTPDPELTPATAQDVALERMLMRALSGPYLSRADRLRTLERESPPTGTVPYVDGSGNDTMADVASRTELTTEESQPGAIPEQSGPRTRTGNGNGAGGSPSTSDEDSGDVPAIWGNVPPRNPNFTGRTDLLDQLGKRLIAGTTAILPSALHGMGGIGKTQMAVEYIYQHLNDYDIVWWIQSSHPSQIRLGLSELAQRLELPGSDESSTAVRAALEALRLGRPHRRWLLIFDSAESPETVRPFFPTNGPGEILVTSRNSDWAAVARPLEIAVFERNESKELLQRRGPAISDEEANQLAEKLGDLPLAIEQAAAWRAQTGMPVAEYLQLFDEKVAEILDTSAPADYELPVAAAWNVSFDELRTRDPAAHQLLQVCAFFAPEPISRHLFTGVRGISILPELDAALRNPMELGRAIRSINRFSLAKIDHGKQTLVMHRLVQAVLRNRMPPEHRADMQHGAHLLLANLDPNAPESSKQWVHYQEILPHAATTEVIDCDDSWVRQLVVHLMMFLYQWGDHGEAIKLAKTTYSHWTSKLGEDDPQTLDVAGQLSFYYWIIGKYAEGAEINEKILELRRRMSGDDSEETLVAQNAVCRDLKAQGDFMAARTISGKVYEKAKALFGDEDPQTLDAARSHGISLRLCGEYRQAATLDEEYYNRHVEIRGHDNADTLSVFSGLIMDRREAGEYLWARQAHETLAERARQFFGEDKPETLRRYSYLAVGLRKAGDQAAALHLSGRILDRYRARYDEETFNALACALSHSIDLRRTGDLRAAHSLGAKTLERYHSNLGEQHPHTIAAAVDLAATLRLSGDAATARQQDQQSLERLRRSLKSDHPHVIACAINLANDHSALGEVQVALDLGTEAAEGAARTLGRDHPIALNARVNRAQDLRTLGQTQESESVYTEVMARYRQVLGSGHPLTTKAATGIRIDCDIDPLPL